MRTLPFGNRTEATVAFHTELWARDHQRARQPLENIMLEAIERMDRWLEYHPDLDSICAAQMQRIAGLYTWRA